MKTRVQPLRDTTAKIEAASPQNRASPPASNIRAKGAIQPWISASTRKASVTHQTPTAK